MMKDSLYKITRSIQLSRYGVLFSSYFSYKTDNGGDMDRLNLPMMSQ